MKANEESTHTQEDITRAYRLLERAHDKISQQKAIITELQSAEGPTHEVRTQPPVDPGGPQKSPPHGETPSPIRKGTHPVFQSSYADRSLSPREPDRRSPSPRSGARFPSSPPPVSRSAEKLAWEPRPTPAPVPYGPTAMQLTDQNLDKIGRKIVRFEPKPSGAHDTHTYLKDIDYYLRNFPNATTDDKMYLIKITSSREVSSFVERQPFHVRNDYSLLCKALISEFSDPNAQIGLTAALQTKQGRTESPQEYYHRLRRAYFGPRNEPDMEEDLNFKALFMQNLHSTTSHHLGVSACPRTMHSTQLREYAVRAFAKQRIFNRQTPDPGNVFTLETTDAGMELEGAFTEGSTPRYSTANKPRQRDKPRRVNSNDTDKTSTSRDRDSTPYKKHFDNERANKHDSPKGERDPHRSQDRFRREHHKPPATEVNKQLLADLLAQTLQSLNVQSGARGGSYPNPNRSRQGRPNGTRRPTNAQPYEEKPPKDVLCMGYPVPDSNSSPVVTFNPDEDTIERVTTEPQGNQTVNPVGETPPDTSNPEATCLTLDAENPDEATLLLSTGHESAVLTVQADPLNGSNNSDPTGPQVAPRFQQFLCKLTERGVARKLYLTVTLEKTLTHEALIDTGADITLMSSELFLTLRDHSRKANRTLKLCRQPLDIRAYSPTTTKINFLALCHLTIGPMTLVHPFYVSPLNNVPLLIGKDLLNRFEPLIDFQNLKIWAQVREPKPLEDSSNGQVQCMVMGTGDTGPDASSGVPKAEPKSPLESATRALHEAMRPQTDLLGHRNTFLCSLGPSAVPTHYCPQVVNGVIFSGITISDAALGLWSEWSAMSLELFNQLQRADPALQLVSKSLRFPLGTDPPSTAMAKGVCALPIKWGNKTCTHTFLVVPDLTHSVYLGADLAVRLAVQLDTINNVLWSLASSQTDQTVPNSDQMKTGQTIPEVCGVINEHNITIPARMAEVSIRLNIRPGHKLNHALAFFQPSQDFVKLGLSVRGTPLLDVTNRVTYLLVDNHTATEVTVNKATPLGQLISAEFHDFELTIPVIGQIPTLLQPNRPDPNRACTMPTNLIAVVSELPLDEDSVCIVDLNDEHHMVVYGISTCAGTSAEESPCMPEPPNTPPQQTPVGQTDPYPGFCDEVQQALALTDTIDQEEIQQQFRMVLYKHKSVFAQDSLDCGLTNIHTVRIPTRPDAPPTFVRQYKIPLASYDQVQKTIDTMLDNGIIRPCNSTYNAPLWPVLKPNGKWRPTVDYRQLNKQVPLSRWPMTQLEQELPKVRDATIFTTLDVASGFWTLPVDPTDQHKLAFTFANKQYTFNRCPFGYANSPAEFNIFLNKACPDANARGNLIYVDDILIRSVNPQDHLKEIDHVLGQLSAAGAKIVLLKGQWLRSKVNYVGLLVGPKGIEPQTSRIQGVQTIKTPSTVSEVRSFLGVCNYSRQFIENYADLARPLTELLKKDAPFVWGDAQSQAMLALKQRLCTAPCLAYPNPDKEFYLEAGFSTHCLSAGLYQKYDQDRRVVAYASKILNTVEIKFSDCEKALFSTVWAVNHFANYVGGQKIIIETCHQPVTFLNSQRIREGVVTNSRIATWLMTFQSHDIEIRYAQNHKVPLGTGLAICQKCTQDPSDPDVTLHHIAPPEPTRHHYFDENTCRDMATVYVDGCSYHHQTHLQAGVGVVWTNHNPTAPQCFQLGPQTSQYAEIAGTLIALQSAVANNVKELVLCTDSNYARLSFTCHLATWKRNDFLTASRKPVKHKDLILACDKLVNDHNMQVYWKKVRGHSRLPGPDKTYNDQTDALAKDGALNGIPWEFHPEWLPVVPTHSVCVVTRRQATVPSDPPDNVAVSLTPSLTDTDLIALQSSDPVISALVGLVSNPTAPPAVHDDSATVDGLQPFLAVKHHLRLIHGLLVYAPDDHTSPRFVVPQSQRGVMLSFAHDSPCAGHRGVKATCDELCQVAYWPHMQQDVAEYIKGCLVCCQFQPAHPNHRAPLQRRGITFPWSDLQIDWVGPMAKSSRGNKYFLTVTCAFTKWVECLPATNDTAQTTACLLMNHVFSRFGLPTRVNSDRGTHFTAEVMRELWQLLGVKAQFHISYHPMSSGQVERANRTVVSILKKYVAANHKDWDVKLPLVLMAIRATPHTSTGVSPFEMMTGRQMTLPLHLLYQPGDTNIATAYTTHQYMTDLHAHLRTTFAFAQKHLEKSAEGRKAYYDQKTSQEQFQVGDKVWYYIFVQPVGVTKRASGNLSKKFLPHWAGPYEIVDKLSPVAYRIKIRKGQKEPTFKWVHRNQIKMHTK